MKTCPIRIFVQNLGLILLLLTGVAEPFSTVLAQSGYSFTYQGRLSDGATAANGSYDLRFTVFSDPVLPNQVGLPQTNNAIPVTNGLFTTILDFGQGWDSQPRWMEVALKPAGSTNNSVVLNPRQLVGAAPRSVYAVSAGQYAGPIQNSQLPNVVARLNAIQSVTGPWSFDPQPGNPPFSVSSSVMVTGLNADMVDGLDATAFWKVGGNAGTTAGTNFLGTTDNQSLEFKVNGTRALRLEPSNLGTGAPRVIGGAAVNFVSPNVAGATISGGGALNWFSAAVSNSILNHGDFATIGGGLRNTCDGAACTVAGGENNTSSAMQAATVGGGFANNSSGNYDTVAGGSANTNTGTFSTVSGGDLNKITRNHSTIGGGSQNAVTGDYASVGGGLQNSVSGFYSTVGGGSQNASTRQYGTVAGGTQNTNTGDYGTVSGGQGNASSGQCGTVGGGVNNSSTGYCATVAGGYANTAGGQFSFAGGQQSRALHNGSFVWADTSGADFTSTAPNQFLIRAAGGVGIGTPAPAAKLHLYSTDNPTTMRIQSTGTPGFGRIEFVSNPQGDINEWRPSYIQSTDNGGFNGGLGFFVNGAGNKFGGVEVMRLVNGNVGIGTNNPSTLLQVGNATCNGTAWANASDRNLKENFKPADPAEVLAKVTALPIQQWSYKSQPGDKHLGPVAQDFHDAFGLGADDKHIATVDADGVALAAIQGLNQKLESELKRRDAENAELKRVVDELKAMVQQLAKK